MKFDWKKMAKICVCIFLLFLGIYYWKAFTGIVVSIWKAANPLIIGCIIAYIVNILMTRYEKWFFPKKTRGFIAKIRRPLCMVFAFLSAAIVIGVIIWLIVPQFIMCVQMLLSALPGLINDLIEKANNWEFIPDDIIDILSGIDWNSRIGQIGQFVASQMGEVVNAVFKTVMGVFSSIVTGVIGIIFSVYLLLDKTNLKRRFKRVMERYLPDAACGKITYVYHVLNDSFKKFIVGQLTEALILGFLCTIGMLIFRMPYATMIGALIAFTALIPVAGAYIGAIVGAIMILTVSPIKALGFLLFILVLQQLEGNIIYPRVVGASIGLPGIWVLAAVTIGGGFFGIAGMLIGVPLTSAVYKILRDDVNRRDAEDKQDAEMSSDLSPDETEDKQKE